jgi:UDP-galactopyranose mutase
MPKDGYTRLFENMLDHPNITLSLGCDYRDVMRTVRYKEVIFSGPVDEFFGFRYGELPYRSLRFEHKTFNTEFLQPVAVVNYPNDHQYTRITEFKHLTGQVHPKTSVVYEFPASQGDPYYPVPTPENGALYKRYAELAAATKRVHFVGRLATYRYYNMDQVVAQALTLCKHLAAADGFEPGVVPESKPAATSIKQPLAARAALAGS